MNEKLNLTNETLVAAQHPDYLSLIHIFIALNVQPINIATISVAAIKIF